MKYLGKYMKNYYIENNPGIYNAIQRYFKTRKKRKEEEEYYKIFPDKNLINKSGEILVYIVFGAINEEGKKLLKKKDFYETIGYKYKMYSTLNNVKLCGLLTRGEIKDYI